MGLTLINRETSPKASPSSNQVASFRRYRYNLAALYTHRGAYSLRILITGAAGFVGSHLQHQLRSTYPDAEIHGTLFSASHQLADPAANAHVINLLDNDAVLALITRVQPDWIFHLAASANVHKSFETPWATLENNLRAQLNVIQGCLRANVAPRILVISSGEVYGVEQPTDHPTREDAPLRPANPYAVSKVAQDMLALQYFLSNHLPIIRARPFNHLGPGQALGFIAPDIARQVAAIETGAQKPLIRCGSLTNERDFTDVRDIVHAYTLLIEHGIAGEVYNVSSGQTCTIRDLVDKILKLSTIPIEIESTANFIRSSGVSKSWGDPTRLRQATGWRQEIPLEQTLLDVLNDWRKRV